ncbi:MAG: ribosome biogenesis GTP-binding protein YihA/YsxC [Acetanaerobacterium sp.]
MNFNNAVFEISFGLSSQLPQSEGFEIAFSGRSNVGKSSLINKLLNRKSLARVSSMPGKTATINFYRLSEDVRLVDLPGYGYAKVSKSEKRRWRELIGGYFSQGRNLVLVVQLLDMRHPPSADDLNMIATFVEQEVPFILMLTKCDKLSKTQRKERMDGFASEIPYVDEITLIPFSSVTGEGVDALREIIEEVTEPDEEVAESDEEVTEPDEEVTEPDEDE